MGADAVPDAVRSILGCEVSPGLLVGLALEAPCRPVDWTAGLSPARPDGQHHFAALFGVEALGRVRGRAPSEMGAGPLEGLMRVPG